MIIYHPAFDAYHGVLRIFSICKSTGVSLEIEKLKIADFYLVFPEHLVSMRLPQKFTRWKKYSRKVFNDYKNSQHKRTLFYSYSKVSRVSLGILLAKGVIDAESYKKGMVSLLECDDCNDLVNVSEKFQCRLDGYFEFITQMALEVPLYGKDGLKDRSGLLEYRNDVL